METKEQFNWWLTSIPDKIADLKKNIDKEVAAKLDGSLQSLDVLEAYLLKHYKVYELNKPENKDLLDQLASYVGDVAEKHLKDAAWELSIKDKKDINYGFPVLDVGGRFFNPFTTVTASLDREQGDYIRECIEVWIK